MVSNRSLLFLGGLLALLTNGLATKSDPAQSYDILYDQAVEAYLSEDWATCVRLMNEAIGDYHFYVDSQVGCRLNCQKMASIDALGRQISPERLEDMKFFEKMVKQTLCLLKCKKNILKNRAEIVSKQIMDSFEYLRPYDYLQLCYYKNNDIIEAASSAYTFLTLNPDHEVMKANLRYYINELKVDPDVVINLEAKPYVEYYIRGSDTYKKEDFDRTANYFELSLIEYLESEDECRAMCEGPFDQGWFPDFISSVANHYTFTLRCKQKCQKKLGNLNGEIHEDLMPSHYHYLQYAYYKLGNVPKALQAVESYLLFFPNDETMLENKNFYLTLPGVKKDMFQPREEALQYFERDRAEKSLLKFIETNFQFDEGDISEPNVSDGISQNPQADANSQPNVTPTSQDNGAARSEEINQISDT